MSSLFGIIAVAVAPLVTASTTIGGARYRDKHAGHEPGGLPACRTWHCRAVLVIVGGTDEWSALGLCVGLGSDAFFETETSRVDQARMLCASCPVIAECAEAGRGERYGVWGGVPAEVRVPRGSRPGWWERAE